MLGNTGIAKFLKIEKLVDSIKWEVQIFLNKKENKKRSTEKIFIIGLNKTGTTSIEKAFKTHKYKTGQQKFFEYLTLSYLKRKNPKRIMKYVQYYDAFQDIPFFLEGIYSSIFEKFPKSKFILSVRDSEQQWYKSFVNYYSIVCQLEKGKMLEMSDFKKCGYVYKGFLYEVFTDFFGTTSLDEDILKNKYKEHNENVISFFKDQPDRLLVINVAKEGSYRKFCDFIGKEANSDSFEWLNKNS